ncbi:phage tail sheath C-terminal domain-containing protein [Salmonella enterica]|uniref:phage tail sheath C-terminal domain-containing protein n=1 Tax=Salmonella enterica TaxID=28901 RepID=UPI0016002792|nr:phage tail sheath C-terminal domain-containing protein [Salmonella enterica]
MSSTDFLHGVRTLEYDDGTKEISTVDISVIGIVGTAPRARGSTAASITIGTELLKNRLQFIADVNGAQGNSWSVTVSQGSGNGAGFSYSDYPDGSCELCLSLPDMTREDSIKMTPDVVVNELRNVNQRRDKFLWPVAIDTGDEAGILSITPRTYLTGGADEPFPLNTPAVIAGSPKKAALLGEYGTLPADVSDIFNQGDAMIVVVRVAEGKDAEETQNNVINGLNQLPNAKQLLDITPRIIIAPDFSATDPVAAQIEVVANKLRGVGYIDSPIAATPADVVRRRQNYGARIEILRPRVYTTSDTSGTPRPYSAIAAGHRCRIDNEKGFWWSKSNQPIYGVTGLEQIDDFEIDSTTCTANQLNKNQVSTIIRYNGFRHWGNYLCSTDPQWSFECVRRTADDIEDSIAIAMMNDFIDRPIDAHLGSDIIETVNGYIRQLYELGAINGGKAWLDSELNTKESLAAGKLYINVEFAPKSPCQTITLTYRINNDYTVEEFASLLKAA